MNSGSPQRLPLQSNLYRVLGEYGFPFVITLVEADAITFSEVYSRDDVYDYPLLQVSFSYWLWLLYHPD